MAGSFVLPGGCPRRTCRFEISRCPRVVGLIKRASKGRNYRVCRFAVDTTEDARNEPIGQKLCASVATLSAAFSPLSLFPFSPVLSPLPLSLCLSVSLRAFARTAVKTWPDEGRRGGSGCARGPRVRRQQRGPPKLNFSLPALDRPPYPHRPFTEPHTSACHKPKPCQAAFDVTDR